MPFKVRFQLPQLNVLGKLRNLRAQARSGFDIAISYFSLRSFVWTLGALIVLSVYYFHHVGGFDLFIRDLDQQIDEGHTEEHIERVVAAELDISEHVDIPIQYGTPLNNEESSYSPAMLGMDVQVPDHVLNDKTEKFLDLFEETAFGDIPVRNEKAKFKSVFEAYKLPFVSEAGAKAVISIAVVDYGLSETISKLALVSLPDNVTLVLSPYSQNIQKHIDHARASHHEVWLDAPIQTSRFGYDDTGPVTLLSGLNNEQNSARLQRLMSLGYGYTGLNFMNRPEFSDAEEGLVHIFSEIERSGLGLVSADPTDRKSEFLASRRKAIPYIGNSVWLNGDQSEVDFMRDLKDLEKRALDQYVVVAYISAQPKIFSIIEDWSHELKSSSIQLVPLSSAIEHK